jgi:hypothetical protein
MKESWSVPDSWSGAAELALPTARVPATRPAGVSRRSGGTKSRDYSSTGLTLPCRRQAAGSASRPGPRAACRRRARCRAPVEDRRRAVPGSSPTACSTDRRLADPGPRLPAQSEALPSERGLTWVTPFHSDPRRALAAPAIRSTHRVDHRPLLRTVRRFTEAMAMKGHASLLARVTMIASSQPRRQRR